MKKRIFSYEGVTVISLRSLSLANKFHEELEIMNPFFAKLCQVEVTDFNNTEREFLIHSEHTMTVTPQQFSNAEDRLNHAQRKLK